MLRNITRIIGVALLATLPLAGTTAHAQTAPESEVGRSGNHRDPPVPSAASSTPTAISWRTRRSAAA